MSKFYLGLDVGTNSVGIACTDENYNLLRAKGKDLWAVRLFDEAQTAQERRTFRSNRRRLQRRKQRIDFLQDLLQPYMQDELFFIRLNNSGFFEDDKESQLNTRFSLFADNQFTDKEFYQKYPTIFHLRKALISESDKPRDLRLYYLALHHIIKYRGHFLIEGESMSNVRDVVKLFTKFNETSQECMEENAFLLPLDKAKEFKDIACSNEKGIKDKENELNNLINPQTKEGKEILKLMIGGSAKVSTIFGEEYQEEKSYSFKKMSDEELIGKESILGENNFNLLLSIKSIYDMVMFEHVLNNNDYISQSMCDIYEKHKKDLKMLKELLKENRDLYRKILKSKDEEFNYSNYIGYTKPEKIKINVKKIKKIEDFYKYLKKELDDNKSIFSNVELFEQIYKEVEEETFLPKIINSDNGLFPQQVNFVELVAILENMEKEYPYMGIRQEDGYSIIDKIKKVFTYRIPYYVGPLNNICGDTGKKNENSWVVRTGEKITPWNFDAVVDAGASSENFIRRMTLKCSYLYGEDVLPKHSIIYQKYDVLNQINKLTFNEQPITVEQKQAIFDGVFMQKSKVSRRDIISFAFSSGWWNKNRDGELLLGGIADKIECSMKSYLIFKKILGEDYVNTHIDVCENIILWHTLNTDKSIVERLILKNYGNETLIKEKIRELKGLSSFKDFGKLSRCLLTEVAGGVDSITGEIKTILSELYNTNFNFNELYWSSRYSFKDNIDQINGDKKVEEINYDYLKEMALSPAVRRGVWQAIRMVDEYVEVLGKKPDKIFVEVNRGPDGSGEKDSRQVQIKKLYKKVNKGDCNEIAELTSSLNGKNKIELRQERLYLYYLQLGRCAYTGKKINLEDISGKTYDVDHIMPRAKTKDDSIDNKVLVCREVNDAKKDDYPIPSHLITNEARNLWEVLKAKKLMSDKKYSLLTRIDPLNEKDFESFVQRQLVITSQSAKAVAELLNKKYGEETKVVYNKASRVSEFRQKFDIYKCRDVNDLHHAHDAYLNIVTGNVYDTKFTTAYAYYKMKGDSSWQEYNLDKLYDKVISNVWNKEETLPKVKTVLSKHSMAITRYSFTNDNEFYNQTVYSGDNGAKIPRKDKYPYNTVNEKGELKYGGYKSLSTAYFMIVESKDKRGKTLKTIEAIPILIDYKTKGCLNKIKEYLEQEGLKDVKILVPKLKIKSLVSINGFRCYIAGKFDIRRISFMNANQWFIADSEVKYIKDILKVLSTESKDGKSIWGTSNLNTNEFVSYNREGEVLLRIDKESNLNIYDIICDRLGNQDCYRKSPHILAVKEILENRRDVFENETCLKQMKVLNQICKFMQCNNTDGVDLTILNASKNSGRIIPSKDITDVNFAIIHQSPCGLTERIQKV